MKKLFITLGLLLLAALMVAAAADTSELEKNWHQWRGPFMTGVSPDGDPPLEWSETKNIKWKIAIPGRGHATPIVWGDQMFIQTAIPLEDEAPPPTKSEEGQGRRRGPPARKTTAKHSFVILSINKEDGKILWKKTLTEELPQEATHDFGSWASNSPITDGEYIYAYFGSRGLFCLDMQGNLKWERDFGQMSKHMEFGEGSSPTLYGNNVIVQWDHNGDSFLYILDKKTGKDVHKIARDEQTSWSTPQVVDVAGKPQVITLATNRIRGYDLETGDLIWEGSGMTRNVIPVPLVQDGILYATSGFRGNALFAIKLAGAKGDITDTDAILWKYDGKETPYTPSGLLHQDKLYLLRSNNGVLSAFNIKTGEPIYTGQRLAGMGNIFTSPSAAKDRMYILGQKGTTYVVQLGPEFKILAKNTLEDSFHSSPVILGKRIYLRGFENLYCIEE
jgi:outer membrane protein assembly factor BamB